MKNNNEHLFKHVNLLVVWVHHKNLVLQYCFCFCQKFELLLRDNRHCQACINEPYSCSVVLKVISLFLLLANFRITFPKTMETVCQPCKLLCKWTIESYCDHIIVFVAVKILNTFYKTIQIATCKTCKLVC